jgi:hypothetical protein
MAQKWNLQDIKPAGAPRAQAPVQQVQEIIERKTKSDISPKIRRPEPIKQSFDDSDLASIDVIDGNEAKRRRVFVTASIGVVIITSGFIMNVLLGGADITVFPKTRDVSVQSEFKTFTEPKVNELGYELLALEATGERQVKASGKEQVSTRAEGKIFVYNTKSATPQRLIKNTRFESSNGLIYRIKESIEIPGVTKDAKGNTVPGSVVADVFADSAGEKYNLAPDKFTVPGLKDTEQYDSVYGESTVAFSGGFEGEKYLIDPSELDTAKQALHLELRDKLLARLNEEKPAGFVVFEGAVNFVYESLPSTEYGDSLATIKEKVTLNIPIFKEDEFAMFIAEKSIPDYVNDKVTLLDPYTLIFSYTNATSTDYSIAGRSNLDFMLKGATKVVWVFDEEELKNKLVSTKKNSATAIFGTYSSISHAQAEVSPFWATSFPDSPKNIKINTVLDNTAQ